MLICNGESRSESASDNDNVEEACANNTRKLGAVLKELGFEVKALIKPTTEDVLACANVLRKKQEDDQTDGVFVFVSAHGEDGGFVNDGDGSLMQVKDIIDALSPMHNAEKNLDPNKVMSFDEYAKFVGDISAEKSKMLEDGVQIPHDYRKDDKLRAMEKLELGKKFYGSHKPKVIVIDACSVRRGPPDRLSRLTGWFKGSESKGFLDKNNPDVMILQAAAADQAAISNYLIEQNHDEWMGVLSREICTRLQKIADGSEAQDFWEAVGCESATNSYRPHSNDAFVEHLERKGRSWKM